MSRLWLDEPGRVRAWQALSGRVPGVGTGLPRPAAQAASFMTECRVCPVRRAWTPITICELP